MFKLSATVITRNEQENIRRCLSSLSFCDEIVVVDDYSNDDTIRIAKRLGAKVYKKELNGDYAAQKNYALSKATGDWVLSIDADEVVNKELANEIKRLTNTDSGIAGYFVRRRDMVFGSKLRGTELGDIKLMRLAKKGTGIWKRKVHEYWDIDGSVGVLSNELIHYSHKNLHEFIDSVNKYAELHSQVNMIEGKRSNLIKIIYWPKLKFIQNFFCRSGYKDRDRGFIVSMIMSFHSFLAWSQLWLDQKYSKKK